MLAPIGGTIIQRQIGVGQNIVSASSGASNPVYTIGDLSKVWLIANVREADTALVHVGDPVSVRVLALPGPRCSPPASAMSPRRSTPIRAGCRCAPRSTTPTAC